MKSVGDRIKQIRMKLGWTQDKLAREAGLSKSFLSDIENDKTRASGDNLLKIADVLGATLDYLMKGNICEDSDKPKMVEIPMELSKAAENLKLSYNETIMLLDINKSIVARRSARVKPKLEKEDWIQLYNKLKPFVDG